MKPKRLAKDLSYGLKSGHIIVTDKSRDFDNDFLKVAQIDKKRKITFLDSNLSQQQIDAIENYAATEDPTVSVTMQKVFETRPLKPKMTTA